MVIMKVALLSPFSLSSSSNFMVSSKSYKFPSCFSSFFFSFFFYQASFSFFSCGQNGRKVVCSSHIGNLLLYSWGCFNDCRYVIIIFNHV